MQYIINYNYNLYSVNSLGGGLENYEKYKPPTVNQGDLNELINNVFSELTISIH